MTAYAYDGNMRRTLGATDRRLTSRDTFDGEDPQRRQTMGTVTSAYDTRPVDSWASAMQLRTQREVLAVR